MNRLTLKRDQPASLRLWHWLNALVILGLLGTVLLRKTVLSWRTNSVLIETKIKEAGGAIETGLAASIAKAIRDVMWEWHIILGFALAGLIVLRALVGFTTKRAPHKEAIESIRAAFRTSGEERKNLLHYAGVKLSYVWFYATIVFMTITGFATYFSKSLGIEKPTLNAIKESHEFAMWFIVVFVIAHVSGVILAELTRFRGIVSDMIHGGDKKP